MAKEMAESLNARVVYIDDHLLKNGAIYWEQIQYEILRSKILTGGPRVIIEGVCIVKVLAKIGISHDYHIFMKLFNGILGWEYEHFLNESVKLPHSSLRREITKYYRDYRPFDICDMALTRFGFKPGGL